MTDPAVEYSPPDVTGMNLFQRLVLVKKTIGKVGKSAQAPAEMGGFRYVPWEHIADRIGDLLADHGIVMLSSMPVYSVEETADKVGVKQKTNYRTTVKLSITFFNADEPKDLHEVVWWGVGDDTSDKGMQKGATNGLKYLLMKTFLLGGLGGTEDSDATTHSGTSASSEAPANYGPCPRPGCEGHVIRKARRDGDDFAACSTNTYNRETRQSGGCAWKDWEPDFEAYEQRALAAPSAPAPAAGEKPFGSGSDCPYCLETGWTAKSGAPARFTPYLAAEGGLLCTGMTPEGEAARHVVAGTRWTNAVPEATVAALEAFPGSVVTGSAPPVMSQSVIGVVTDKGSPCPTCAAAGSKSKNGYPPKLWPTPRGSIQCDGYVDGVYQNHEFTAPVTAAAGAGDVNPDEIPF